MGSVTDKAKFNRLPKMAISRPAGGRNEFSATSQTPPCATLGWPYLCLVGIPACSKGV